MLAHLANSLLFRLTGRRLYNATKYRTVSMDACVGPPGYIAVSPQQAIFDPAVFGTYHPATERTVPLGDPLEGAFSLDIVKHGAKRAGTSLDIDRYAQALSMLPPGNGVCLDACTGSPRPDVKRGVEAKGFAYKAIDLDPGGNQDVQREDLLHLSFASNSISGIISCDTIEHIADYRTAATELLRVLAPRGALVIHFPVYFFDKANGAEIRDGVDPWEHVRYFSAREMLAMFHEIGFVIMRATFNFDYGAMLAVLCKPAAI